MKKEKKNYLKREYEICFNYIKESKNYIFGIIFIFLLFALLGFFIPLPEEIKIVIIEYFKEIVKETEGFNSIEMTFFLFQNNVLASFLSLVLGIIVGIFPVINSILNGFVLGFASKLSVVENGIFSLWRLFPHGIFELPALFISLGLGLKLGIFIFKKEKTFKESFKKSIKTFIFIVIPLLIIAAIIEGILIVFSS